FFQAEDGIRDRTVTGVQTCALPIFNGPTKYEVLRLAFEGRPKSLNYVSTTFIFGWAVKKVLYETDFNENMELLDFGYSQSKWVRSEERRVGKECRFRCVWYGEKQKE